MEEVVIQSENKGVGLGVEDRWCKMSDNGVDRSVKQVAGVLRVEEAVLEVI